MYCLLLPPGNARVFVEQLFGLFDSDKGGTIDFKVEVSPFLKHSHNNTSGVPGCH